VGVGVVVSDDVDVLLIHVVGRQVQVVVAVGS
jgi:hypothetical protein